VRGTWDGFGLRLVPPATTAAATTDIDLPAGTYKILMRVDCGDRCPDGAEVALSANGADLRRMPWPAAGSTEALAVPITHAGGNLHLEIRIDGHFNSEPSKGSEPPATGSVGQSPTSAHAKFLNPSTDVAALWVAAFEVEREQR